MRRALPISESTCRRSSILSTAPSTAPCEHFTQGSCLDREKRRKLVFHLFITWHSDPLRLRRHDGRSCWCRRPTGGMNYKLWIYKHCFRENNWRTQWKSGIKTCVRVMCRPWVKIPSFHFREISWDGAMLWLKLNWVSIGDSSCGLDSLILCLCFQAITLDSQRLSPVTPWGGSEDYLGRIAGSQARGWARVGICCSPLSGHPLLPSIGRT